MKQLAAADDEFLGIILDALPFETNHGYLPFGEVARTGQGKTPRWNRSRPP